MTEKVVTRRSSLTAYERALRLKQNRPPPLTKAGRDEIKLTQLYRDPRNFPPPRPVTKINIPDRPRTPRPPNPYNKGPVPAPGPIRTPYRVVGESRIPWGVRENLKWHVRQLHRRLGYLSPWLRALNFALDAYDFWKFREEFERGLKPGSYVFTPGYEVTQRCAGGPGTLTLSDRWNQCLSHYGTIQTHSPTAVLWHVHMVDHTDLHWLFKWPMHHPLMQLRKTALAEKTPPEVWYREGTVAMAATALQGPVPHLPVPLRNFINHAMRHPETMQPGQPSTPRPPPIVTGGHRWRPPGPREKEQKFKLNPVLAALMKGAWSSTEAVDLIDVFWKSLPEHIQKTTPKTGRTYGNARIGVGKPYSDPVDKALHVWKNFEHIDWKAFLGNFAGNQLEDYIVGKTSGEVAAFLKKNGVTVTGINLVR